MAYRVSVLCEIVSSSLKQDLNKFNILILADGRQQSSPLDKGHDELSHLATMSAAAEHPLPCLL